MMGKSIGQTSVFGWDFRCEHRTWGTANDVLRDTAHEKTGQAGVPMRSHYDEIDGVFLGNPLDLARGITWGEDMVHRQSAFSRNVILEVLFQPCAITGRLELRDGFAISHIFGSQGFDDVQHK